VGALPSVKKMQDLHFGDARFAAPACASELARRHSPFACRVFNRDPHWAAELHAATAQ
jgi:hypothetical protein